MSGNGMLVLRRDISKSVFVGDDIEVKVLDVKRGQVLLGFKAPKHVNIKRDDIKNDQKGE